MECYARELKDQQDISAPRQKLIFAQRWSLGMESFVKRFMPDPVVLIDSKMEAAFYGKVKQVSENLIPMMIITRFSGVGKYSTRAER